MDLVDLSIPVWLYRLLAAFPATGLLGIDHFAIGSKYTGMAKAFLNLITFGAWYIYDIVQSLDGPKITQQGLSIPFVEISGIGAGKLFEGNVLNQGAKNFLNLFFTSIAAILGVVGTLLKENPGGLGTLGTTLQAGGGAATVGLGAFTVMNFVKKAAVPPSIMSAAQQIVQTGGGVAAAEQRQTEDIFLIGGLLLLAAGGFSLAAVRQE
jgi:hypothetical protein